MVIHHLCFLSKEEILKNVYDISKNMNRHKIQVWIEENILDQIVGKDLGLL